MKVLLDEVRIADDQSVDVRVVPLDPGDSRAEIQENYPPGTPMAEMIVKRYLWRIALALGADSPITAAVHAGEDTYTIITRAQDFIEVDLNGNPEVRKSIQAIADLLATIEAFPRNRVVPSGRGPGPQIRRHMNALRKRPEARNIRYRRVRRERVLLPGETNPWHEMASGPRPHYLAPNRFVRVG